MIYKWGINHGPLVHIYKDITGFISLHKRPSCGQLIVKHVSEAGNETFVITTFGFQTECGKFVWWSYRKKDHANLEIYRHSLIWQMGFR